MPIFLNGNVERDYQAPAEFDTTFDDYRKAKWAEGLGSNPLQLYEDYSAFESANNQPKLKLDDINSRLDSEGIKMDVPQDGLSAQALDMLIGRKKKNQKLQEAIEYSPGGMRSLAGFGVTLGASFMDPLNIGLAFVPAVGPARYAAMVKGASSAFGRAGVRAGVGAAEGALGTAIIEPFMYGAHQALRDDYTAVDSLINIGVGSVFGGGLHVIGGAGVDAYKKWRTSEGLDIPVLTETLTNAPQPIKTVADDVVPQPADDMPAVFSPARYDPNSAAAVAEFATPQTREVALRSAVAQIVEGRAVDVDVAFKADPGAGVPQQSKAGQLLREWIEQTLQPGALRGANAGDDVIYKILDRAKFSGEAFTDDFKFSDVGLYDYEIRDVPLNKLNLLQEGEDRLNDSSRESARALREARSVDDLPVKTDVIPILLNEDMDVVDGHHRYTAAELNGYQTIPALVPIGEGSGKVINIETYGIAKQQEKVSLADQMASTAARQASPESVRVADIEGSKAADEKLAVAPKSESLQDAEAELAKVMANLEERLGIPPKTDDPNAVLKTSTKDWGDMIEYSIVSADGKSRMDAEVSRGIFSVKNIYVAADMRGKGVGKLLYKKAISEASDAGYKFVSDITVSEDAMRVYKSLEKEGYKFKYNEKVSRDVDTTFSGEGEKNQIVSTNNKPVVELAMSPPKQQPAENPVLAELKIYDEAIASADQLSLAAKAAAICDMRG